jgi:hypothetical protein
MLQFDFGKNWANYSVHAISAERVAQAREDFIVLHEEIGDRRYCRKIVPRRWVGQGLSLLSAAALGARVFGIDIDPKCEQILRRNQRLFARTRSCAYFGSYRLHPR